MKPDLIAIVNQLLAYQQQQQHILNRGRQQHNIPYN